MLFCLLSRHLLIVFGGLKGLESCLEGDETIEASDPSELFNYYLNTCPSQGSRTIRTEEAILITLAALRPGIIQSQTDS
ncbi:Putative methyltransferase C9orf114 [Araneus ventricosus]|uniref:Methyltransferase C9orf114 n=1 Tax=Araneus ventricosus TaxID=182803 RepID=A0A4Y2KU26_ARAVE|nr:Putative methyltransferase C9orf114 [Araneus ventricosus]